MNSVLFPGKAYAPGMHKYFNYNLAAMELLQIPKDLTNISEWGHFDEFIKDNRAHISNWQTLAIRAVKLIDAASLQSITICAGKALNQEFWDQLGWQALMERSGSIFQAVFTASGDHLRSWHEYKAAARNSKMPELVELVNTMHDEWSAKLHAAKTAAEPAMM